MLPVTVQRAQRRPGHIQVSAQIQWENTASKISLLPESVISLSQAEEMPER